MAPFATMEHTQEKNESSARANARHRITCNEFDGRDTLDRAVILFCEIETDDPPVDVVLGHKQVSVTVKIESMRCG